MRKGLTLAGLLWAGSVWAGPVVVSWDQILPEGAEIRSPLMSSVIEAVMDHLFEQGRLVYDFPSEGTWEPEQWTRRVQADRELSRADGILHLRLYWEASGAGWMARRLEYWWYDRAAGRIRSSGLYTGPAFRSPWNNEVQLSQNWAREAFRVLRGFLTEVGQ